MLQKLSRNLFVLKFSQLLTILRKKAVFFFCGSEPSLGNVPSDNFLSKTRFNEFRSCFKCFLICLCSQNLNAPAMT